MRKPTVYLSAAAFAACAALFVGITFAAAHASPAPSQLTGVNRAAFPTTRDAFAHWVYNGSSPTVITVTIGSPVTLDLYIDGGSNNDLVGQQSYLEFSHTLFQVVQAGQPSCVLTSTLTPDTTTFDAPLQNEVCNGPGPCNLRGVNVPPGSIAYASGALTNCPTGCGGDFRVARIGLCGTSPGQGLMRWQFSPPDPTTRDSEVLNRNGGIVSSPALYHNLIVNVVGGSATSTPVSTPTPTAIPCPSCPTASPTRTRTATLSPTTTPTGTLPTPTPCAMSFNDVFATDYFYQAVRYLYCEGAISGYADGYFRPYNNATRGQLSKITVLAEGWLINTQSGPHFSDVPNTNPFYAYIETAYNRGIISGYSDGTFLPGNNVTRGQLSKIVVRAEGWSLITRSTPTFSDVPAGSPFFTHVETAYCHGIISGYSDGTFRPGNNATRGQISKIVYEARAGGHVCQ